MYSGSGPEVVSQDHAHIHPPERIGLNHDLSRTQYARHGAGPVRVTPSNDHPGQTLSRVGVAEEDYVDAVRAQHSGSGSRHTLPAGAIQNLHYETTLHRRNGDGALHDRFALGQVEVPAYRREQNDSGRQREPEPAATKLFQNRTVGSRIGHPVLTRWRIRVRATSRRTPPDSLGRRSASSARASRSNGRSGSR